jgi:hypothetical protein
MDLTRRKLVSTSLITGLGVAALSSITQRARAHRDDKPAPTADAA